MVGKRTHEPGNEPQDYNSLNFMTDPVTVTGAPPHIPGDNTRVGDPHNPEDPQPAQFDDNIGCHGALARDGNHEPNEKKENLKRFLHVTKGRLTWRVMREW